MDTQETKKLLISIGLAYAGYKILTYKINDVSMIDAPKKIVKDAAKKVDKVIEPIVKKIQKMTEEFYNKTYKAKEWIFEDD